MQRRRFSLASDSLPMKTPMFYGWIIVILGGLGIFFSGPGQTYSVSVFGGYSEILLVSMLFPMLGVLAALLSPKPIRREAKSVGTETLLASHGR